MKDSKPLGKVVLVYCLLLCGFGRSLLSRRSRDSCRKRLRERFCCEGSIVCRHFKRCGRIAGSCYNDSSCISARKREVIRAVAVVAEAERSVVLVLDYKRRVFYCPCVSAGNGKRYVGGKCRGSEAYALISAVSAYRRAVVVGSEYRFYVVRSYYARECRNGVLESAVRGVVYKKRYRRTAGNYRAPTPIVADDIAYGSRRRLVYVGYDGRSAEVRTYAVCDVAVCLTSVDIPECSFAPALGKKGMKKAGYFYSRFYQHNI